MDIKLVKQLMEDNKLFKPASSDEQVARKDQEENILRKRFYTIKIGDKVMINDYADVTGEVIDKNDNRLALKVCSTALNYSGWYKINLITKVL